jgi:XTP/dITP diphosphohydrolase
MPAHDPRTVVLASRNAHKLAELRRLLAPAGIELAALPELIELPPEDGDRYETIALSKARAAAAALSRPAIADDSGIEAAALRGAPGVRSARFAGPRAGDQENVAKLMLQAPAGSALRFVCALAYVDPEAGVEGVFIGDCAGWLAAAPRGAHGFGYDPVFVPDGGPPGRTLAEYGDDQKDAISHRGNAARAFAAWLCA